MNYLNNLQNKNLYLAPKNDVTQFFNQLLMVNNITIKGYLDNFKTDEDIIDKAFITDDDVVIIYSPNYWKQISSKLNTKNILILFNENNSLQLSPINEFDAYTSTFKIDHNTLFAQKIIWAYCLKSHYEISKQIDGFGYIWGDPNMMDHPLGNYLKIKNLLLHNTNSDTTILEIGTLSGKWTKYMTHAQKIVCVDINDYFINVIKERFAEFINKIDFYVTSGDELNGIKTNSIDMIFTMDTLVRTESIYIYNYIKEISRVLKKDGKAIIHLPNSDIEDSKNRKFTDISTKELETELSKYFINYKIDFTTIKHGCLIFINIDENI